MATQVDGVITKISTGDNKEYAVASTAYGYCQTAAATAAKEVDMDGFELKTGVTIFVKFQYANSAGNPTLNVNDTGAKPIYRYGTTRASTNASTNGWSAGAVLTFTYDGAGWIEHYWANNQYTLSNLYHGTGNFIADSPVYRYQMLFHVNDDILTPLNNSNNVTAETKTMLTSMEFDPFNEIYFYSSTTNVADGGNIGGGACYWHQSAMDLRYTFNIDNDYLTAHKNVYLKCSKQSNGKFRIASASPLTQALPTTNDGYHYIHLGRATSGYQMTLYRKHPIYYHDGTSVRIYTNPANDVSSISGGRSEILFFPNQTVNSEVGGELFRITDSAITTDTIVLSCVFADKTVWDPVSCTSYDGYITFTGTCISATTADVILTKKSN